MGPLEIPKKDHELIDLQAKVNSSQSPEHSPKTDHYHYELFCVYIALPINETLWIIERVAIIREFVIRCQQKHMLLNS